MSDSSGARLKKMRLEKGLSLEDVRKVTRVHLHILKAIEEDTLVNLNPVYIKGFLKIYCKFLGVDPKDYIANYKEPQGVSTAIPTRKKEEKAKASLLHSASLRLGWVKKINFKKLLTVVVIVLVAVFVLRTLINLGKFIGQRISSVRREAKAAAALVEKKDKKAAETNNIPAKAAHSASTVRLAISAKEDCWMQVKADGKVIFKNVLKKGRSESWEAKGKIELSVANAGVIVVEVNGQNIPSLGKKGQAIKNIMITKEGLEIKR